MLRDGNHVTKLGTLISSISPKSAGDAIPTSDSVSSSSHAMNQHGQQASTHAPRSLMVHHHLTFSRASDGAPTAGVYAVKRSSSGPSFVTTRPQRLSSPWAEPAMSPPPRGDYGTAMITPATNSADEIGVGSHFDLDGPRSPVTVDPVPHKPLPVVRPKSATGMSAPPSHESNRDSHAAAPPVLSADVNGGNHRLVSRTTTRGHDDIWTSPSVHDSATSSASTLVLRPMPVLGVTTGESDTDGGFTLYDASGTSGRLATPNPTWARAPPSYETALSRQQSFNETTLQSNDDNEYSFKMVSFPRST